MDIVLILAVILFTVLLLSWLFLPHTKELSESSTEFGQIADEAQMFPAR
jgi:hypothetical protein